MLTCWDNEETAFENAQHWRKNTVREGGEREGRERGRGGREEGEGGEMEGGGRGGKGGGGGGEEREGWGLEALRRIHKIRVQSDGTSGHLPINLLNFTIIINGISHNGSSMRYPISNLHASHFARQS